MIDFTDNDTTKVSNVVLYVKTAKDNYVPLNATYDEKKNLWIASGEFGSWSNYDIPVNVAVDFEANVNALLDSELLSSIPSLYDDMLAEHRLQMQKYDILLEDTLDTDSTLYADGFLTEEDILRSDSINNYFEDLSNEELDSLIALENTTDFSELLDSLELINSKMEESLVDSLAFDYDFGNGISYSLKTCEGLTDSILINEGFTEYATTKGTIYIRNLDYQTEYINFEQNTYVTIRNKYATVLYSGSSLEEGFDSFNEWMDKINSTYQPIANAYEDLEDKIGNLVERLEKELNQSNAEFSKRNFAYKMKQVKMQRLENELKNLNSLTIKYVLKQKEIADFKKELNESRRLYLLANKNKTLANTMLKVSRSMGMHLKKCIPLAKYGDIVYQGVSIVRKFQKIYLSVPNPCKDDQKKADDCRTMSVLAGAYAGGLLTVKLGTEALLDFATAGQVVSAGATGGVSLGTAFATVVAKMVAGIALDAVFNWEINRRENQINSVIKQIKCDKDDDNCKRCGKDPCECKDNCPKCGHKPCICNKVCTKCGHNPCVCNKNRCPICGQKYCEHFRPPHVPPIHDPSGYVYEGVSSNRLEGVMASCYYKETVEDMYGDLHENIVLWDAEQYAQENPLFTDENGMYRWDVPQGLWQVKFEKEGYQTTYSEWLPVPPPQLEVNIAMTQNRQPEVVSARAYEDGIEVEFDKYMQLEGLNTENIFVTKNGETVAGAVTLLNEEQAYEDNPITYASKVRFVPEVSFLTTDEVTLTVSRKVKSYVGIQMEEDYMQSFDIEKEVKSLVADSLIKVAYNGDKQITVSALPYDAAIGKKMIVKNSSSMIASISADTLTLDEKGQASLTLNGDLPGTAMLTFSLADADVQTLSTVQVVSPELLMIASPKATRASGTAVYRGTEVGLTCATEGAVIYYTLDGSCPCDENAPRMVYEHPIAITEDMTIKAMAMVDDLEESEVAEFSFTIKTTNLGMDLKEGWNWVSHNMETEIATTALPQNAPRIVGQTAELVKDPVYGLIGNLKALQPDEAYKVQMDADSIHVMSGYEFNPTTSIDLKSGWNWLGYPLSQTMSLSEAFVNMQPDDEDYIVGQDGFAQYANGTWTGTLQTLNPGMGYMYHSQSDKNFAYNSAIVSRARAIYGRGIKNETPWAVDKNRYPNVMSLVADLYVEGRKKGANSYAVGAFCGTECRGVGKYVSGKLMMTIYGNGNEKITFRAMNNETEEVFDIVEQTVFTETLLGRLYMPFALNVGNASTISEAEAAWKVWPAVATENLYLSLNGNTFDRVTLTDVYGSVALVKEHVEEGEAIHVAPLADGIYIVTAVQGGNMYYKKIVKVGK